MKKILLLAVMACGWLAAGAQSSAVSIVEQGQAKADASLGNTSVAVFLSKGNNLVITSNNPSDKVALPQRQSNGQYATEVTCDLTAGGGSKRTFTVVIKGTSIQSRADKAMKAGKRFTFLVEEAEHMLTFWWPETKNVAYTSQSRSVEGKSLVEFQCPTDIQNPIVKFSNNMGGEQLPTVTERGVSMVRLEVDCNMLKQTLADKQRKEAEIAALQRQYDELHATNDAKAGDASYDIAAGEQQEEALQKRMEDLQNTLPNVYVILTGKSCNQVPLSEDRIRQLLTPKYRLTVGVNDAMAGEASFDDLLSQAREYYRNFAAHGESSYYDAGRTAYDKVLEHKDCPVDQRQAIRDESDTLRSLRRNTFLIEKAEEKAQGIEAQKGFNDPDVYKYLAGAVRFCDRILTYHPDIKPIQATKERLMARISQHPNAKTQVTETVTRQRLTITGRVTFKNEYMAMPHTSMRVYASETPKIGLGKTSAIGKLNADYTFSVVKPDGMDYIYVTGEKDKAHMVSPGMTHLDIVIK